MGMWKQRWVYCTGLSIPECIGTILREPRTFGDNPFNLENYECIFCSDSQLLVTFTGCHFGKMKRTEYLMHFHPGEKVNHIFLEFRHELLGFPPMTSVLTIDKFMQEKIQASRIE